MTIVTILKAETELSDLVARVEAGEEIIIARGDKPVVKLVPVEAEEPAARVPGRFSHLRDKIPADLFLEPVSDDELDAWEGKNSHASDCGR